MKRGHNIIIRVLTSSAFKENSVSFSDNLLPRRCALAPSPTPAPPVPATSTAPSPVSTSPAIVPAPVPTPATPAPALTFPSFTEAWSWHIFHANVPGKNDKLKTMWLLIKYFPEDDCQKQASASCHTIII